MKRVLPLILPLLALPILFGCSPVMLLNTITPSGSFERAKDLRYADHDRGTYDLYTPQTAKAGAPVLIFVHGGSWTDGSKDIYKFLAEGFTKDGYTVAVPNYRLYPDARYPEMIDDTRRAIEAIGARFPGQKLVVIGHSAGGYNALMATMASGPALSEAARCERVSGVIALAAPTGAYPMTDEPYVTIFPGRLTGDDAPLNLTPTRLPPIMLVNGRDDTTVGAKNSERLAAKLEEAGHDVRLEIYDGMDHTDPVRVLSRHFDGDSPLKGDMVAFINQLPRNGDTCRSAAG